jgi:hypothetical protein
LLFVALGAIVAGGCRHETSDEEEAAKREAAKKALAEKKNEPPKDPFEFKTLNVRPSETDRITPYVKPGHWTTAVVDARANHNDFSGVLITDVLAADNAPAELDGIPSHLVCSRPVILPKGQWRSLDVDLLLPVSAPSRLVGIHLLAGPSGRDVATPSRELLVRMPAHQYWMVGLVRTPEEYLYLNSLDSVRAPGAQADDRTRQAHYRVLLPTIKTAAPLPTQSLYWTTIAYVVWDDLEPGLLSPDQQRAMIDWLHWGGQIIVSGPGSLDSLRKSFLEPYLPVAGGDTWTMDERVLADLSRAWSRSRELSIAKPWSGQKLLPRGAAGQRTLATDPSGQPLVVERLVGAGRVVVTAFRLSQKELVDWPGYDGFFNACLLRRGPRRFGRNAAFDLAVDWEEGNRYDPRLSTRVRYFTRDADAKTGTVLRTDSHQELWAGQQMSMSPDGMDMGGSAGGGLGGTTDVTSYDSEPLQGAGVAGWNDNSPVSELARRSLREAAGITVPKASFVLAILGAYVIVLVPLNWFIFSRLGRVEWAWIAAPIVAIVFGLLVVWLAQVNIGFARSATEVAVLEVQAGYGRGHLTRYTALYSSLSTSYDLSLSGAGAAALPMPARTDPGFLQSRSTVTLRRRPGSESASPDDDATAVSLEGFQVSSNSTGMVHSEQMLDLGGTVDLEPLATGRCRVRNGTRYALRGAGLVKGRLMGWIGTVEPGQTATVELTERKTKTYFREWESFVVAAKTASTGEISLRPLLELACDQASAGQIRLVAWTDEELPGMSIQPGAAQFHRATLVVANMSTDPEPPPRPDVNSRAEVPGSFDEEEARPGGAAADVQPTDSS